jgi:hypothetical protein
MYEIRVLESKVSCAGSLLRECSMAAVNWLLQYFLDEDLQKNTVNLLWAAKTAHFHSVMEENLQQEMTVFHWPITMIDLCGVSHFVSIFSGSWWGWRRN